LRQRDPGVIASFRSHAPLELALSTVVVAELCYGAYRSPSPAANLRLIQQLTDQVPCLPFDTRAADIYGQIRADLERRGQLIGAYDMLIAATALSHGITLVTHNTKEFNRIAGLTLEDWHSS